MTITKKNCGAGLAVSGLLVALGLGAATAAHKDVSRQTSEASVVTNDNGTVSRHFTECTVSTNGSMVTERRCETRTVLDEEGNMLETSTSEYARSYSVGDPGMTTLKPSLSAKSGDADAASCEADSFLGLRFGETCPATNFVNDADEPTLLRASFVPKKSLAGFDDFFVYVTPKTRKIVKICACAKKAIDPGAGWRRHYLIEALEKRYRTWARPRSPFRPIYSFDLGGGRFITTCLSGTSRDCETIIVAWDDALLNEAAEETEALRAEARKAADERRRRRVEDAAEAF